MSQLLYEGTSLAIVLLPSLLVKVRILKSNRWGQLHSRLVLATLLPSNIAQMVAENILKTLIRKVMELIIMHPQAIRI